MCKPVCSNDLTSATTSKLIGFSHVFQGFPEGKFMTHKFFTQWCKEGLESITFINYKTLFDGALLFCVIVISQFQEIELFLYKRCNTHSLIDCSLKIEQLNSFLINQYMRTFLFFPDAKKSVAGTHQRKRRSRLFDRCKDTNKTPIEA